MSNEHSIAHIPQEKMQPEIQNVLYKKQKGRADPLKNFFPFFNIFQMYLNLFPAWTHLISSIQFTDVSYTWKHNSGLRGSDPHIGFMNSSNDSHSSDVIHCQCPLLVLPTSFPAKGHITQHRVTPDSVNMGGDCHPSRCESRRERFQMASEDCWVLP